MRDKKIESERRDEMEMKKKEKGEAWERKRIRSESMASLIKGHNVLPLWQCVTIFPQRVLCILLCIGRMEFLNGANFSQIGVCFTKQINLQELYPHKIYAPNSLYWCKNLHFFEQNGGWDSGSWNRSSKGVFNLKILGLFHFNHKVD